MQFAQKGVGTAVDSTNHNPSRVLGIFLLATMNMAVITSLRNLPLVAQYGLSSIVYYLLAACLFIIPSALVSAELATGWPKGGGVYIWVREAFGDRWGFVAIWMQWVHNLPWYPALLSFIGATLAYGIGFTDFASNKIYTFCIIIIGFWGSTLLNFMGIKTSSRFSSFCVIIGTLIPGIAIVILGFMWFFGGNPIQTPVTAKALIPDFTSFNNIVFITGLFLAFAGLEVNSVHAREVKTPHKTFPRAIFIAAFFTLGLFIIGSLSIAFVIPQHQISLVAGLMEAFKAMFDRFHLGWLTNVVALLIVVGAAGELNAWIAGPSKGLFVTARHGSLPPLFQKINKHNVPVAMLTVQAIIVTISSLIFLYAKDLSTAYWILIALSAQIYLVMYFLMFIAAIALRYKKPNVHRSYRVSKGNFGMWLVAGIGALASIFACVIGFFPPTQLPIEHVLAYEIFLLITLVITFIIPFFIYHFRKPHWMPTLHHDPLHSAHLNSEENP